MEEIAYIQQGNKIYRTYSYIGDHYCLYGYPIKHVVTEWFSNQP